MRHWIPEEYKAGTVWFWTEHCASYLEASCRFFPCDCTCAYDGDNREGCGCWRSGWECCWAHIRCEGNDEGLRHVTNISRHLVRCFRSKPSSHTSYYDVWVPGLLLSVSGAIGGCEAIWLYFQGVASCNLRSNVYTSLQIAVLPNFEQDFLSLQDMSQFVKFLSVYPRWWMWECMGTYSALRCGSKRAMNS